MVVSITHMKQSTNWSNGSQLKAIIRTGRSDNGYRLGDELAGTYWIARKWSKSFSTSFRLYAKTWGDIEGSDSELNPMMVPTASPNTSGRIINWTIGFNYLFTNGPFKHHRIAFEYSQPLYFKVDSIQMNPASTLLLGWQYSL